MVKTRKPSPLSYAIPMAIEIAGMFVISMGIAIEIVTKADFGHFIITGGSAVIALGSFLWSKVMKIREMY